MRKDWSNIEMIAYKGYEIKIDQDNDLDDSPRSWDNLGTLVCWHRRCDLGDCNIGRKNPRHEQYFATVEELQEYLLEHKNEIIGAPVYLYEHSGQTIQCHPFSDPWDSGRVGIIYALYSDILKWFKRKRITKKLLTRASEALVNEIKTYDTYLRGDVWTFSILKDGEYVDVCGGFYGYDYCIQEAKNAVDWEIRNRTKEAYEHAMLIPVEAE